MHHFWRSWALAAPGPPLCGLLPLLLCPSLSPSLPHWRTAAGNSLGILLLSLSYIHFRENKSRLTFSTCISEVITSWLLHLEGSLKGSPYLPNPGLILSHLQNPKSWPTHRLCLLSHCHLLHFLFLRSSLVALDSNFFSNLSILNKC